MASPVHAKTENGRDHTANQTKRRNPGLGNEGTGRERGGIGMTIRGIRRPLYGLGSALLIAGVLSAGSVGAQDDGGGSPLIDAEVVATIEVAGGDAQGGDANGGNAGLYASVTDAGGASVAQHAELLQGGTVTGGDAQGGDGLNAYVDANVILDADIALDVAADVDVTTVAGASLDLGELPLDGITSQAVAQPITGRLNGITGRRGLDDTANNLTSALPGADLGGALGGLGGLNLLDLVAELDVEVSGGDATGGTATGGNAVLEATIDGASGHVSVDQMAGKVYGGDATGGNAIGGDGIELDVLLDADIELIVDANVDIAADVATFIEGDVALGAGQRAARLARFESE